MGKQTIRQALHQLTHNAAHSNTPVLDAQVLLAHIVQKPRAWVLAYPETTLAPQQQKSLREAAARLQTGTPLPYILGHWEFYGLDFTLSPDVLIPRPETELLIEEALQWLQAHPQKRRAADSGTGSGCIAITLAKHISDLHIAASDISPAALKIARANAEKHHVAERIEFTHANLLADNLQSTTLDLIAANLPYIPTQTLHMLDVYECEPTLALDGGENGLKLIGRALEQAQRNLARGWLMLFEIDSSHGERAAELAQHYYPHAKIRILPDLTGRDRLLRIEDILCKPD